MTSITANIVSHCKGFAVGCLLMSVMNVSAHAQALPSHLLDEQMLSIEAPQVRLLFERAALMERLKPIVRNQRYAAHLYCAAARLGSLEAQYRLGKMVLAGWGMRKSEKNAAALFSIAARQGHEQASLALSSTTVQLESLPKCMETPGASIDIDVGDA